jgi:hypothetical protein
MEQMGAFAKALSLVRGRALHMLRHLLDAEQMGSRWETAQMAILLTVTDRE